MPALPNIVIAIDPGTHKTGVAALVIRSGEGYMPNGREVDLLPSSEMIRAKGKDLAQRLADLGRQVRYQVEAARREAITDGGVTQPLAIVIEDPRDFPGRIRGRAGASNEQRTSTATNVTIGAGFGICLAEAYNVAHANVARSGTPPILVATQPSQKWYPRHGGRKLTHEAARAWLEHTYPILKGQPEDVIFAAGMGLYWYTNTYLTSRLKGVR